MRSSVGAGHGHWDAKPGCKTKSAGLDGYTEGDSKNGYGSTSKGPARGMKKSRIVLNLPREGGRREGKKTREGMEKGKDRASACRKLGLFQKQLLTTAKGGGSGVVKGRAALFAEWETGEEQRLALDRIVLNTRRRYDARCQEK